MDWKFVSKRSVTMTQRDLWGVNDGLFWNRNRSQYLRKSILFPTSKAIQMEIKIN